MLYILVVSVEDQYRPLAYFSKKEPAIAAMDKVQTYLSMLPIAGNIVRLGETLSSMVFLPSGELTASFELVEEEIKA